MKILPEAKFLELSALEVHSPAPAALLIQEKVSCKMSWILGTQNVTDFGDAKCHRFFGCKMTGIFGMQNVTDFGNTNFYGFCDILILKSGLKLNISYEGKSWFEYLLGVKDLTFCIFDCSTSCWCTQP